MSRNVYNSIDITKFLMAILVIAIHTTNLQNCNTYWIQNVFYNVADMAVPFFFVCSSFFLSIKCQDIEQTERKIKIVNNYFWRIMRLYLLWNLVYFPFAIYGFVKNRDSLTTAIAKYIVDLVFKGEHYYSWPLWYLLAIIYSSILLCFLLSLSLNHKKSPKH